ncbi:disease resistance protein RUN1-like [Eucalyptus grandis]|uniref:disease resistance protein RUN1-like n=1 Tax=Eucalyptus grandis TaxID=71139 RepID=UPI00192EE251|nr:disease resistance protein RUN1-like [Eucalyptus grandis]
MAASSNMKRNYHVFLGFGGRMSAKASSVISAALDQKGISTFVDSEELRKGEEISSVLMRAIEESHVVIIIFSEHYASSWWCLEELLKFMECKEKNGLIVFLVFYKVEPREVRKGRESYGRVMAKHEFKFGKDSEKVKRWKKSLFEAGSLSGWELNDRSMGTWGIGKTTIARALYNAIEAQFQGCSFLERVRENSNQSRGLVALQEQLLSQILSPKSLTIYSVDGGISLIRERLCCKKVLLVLDDVDQLNQLQALAREGNWFGEGSRIIVTSRDKHLLTCHKIRCVYEVEALKNDAALDLFGRYAFSDSKKVQISRDLIDRALHYANGLLLALKVLGSFLCGRNEAAWESALHKLSKSPEQTINQVLKTSFDGLEYNEREIFLDITCFFKGKEKEYIKKVLDDCGFDTTIGIDILIERSLIKNENGIVQMHDFIQLMGKDIVNQEWPNDPRKRSRLWLFEDVQDFSVKIRNLKSVMFYDCNSLASIPDLSLVPHLESFKLTREILAAGFGGIAGEGFSEDTEEWRAAARQRGASRSAGAASWVRDSAWARGKAEMASGGEATRSVMAARRDRASGVAGG